MFSISNGGSNYVLSKLNFPSIPLNNLTSGVVSGADFQMYTFVPPRLSRLTIDRYVDSPD